jgi:hypothetical protein
MSLIARARRCELEFNITEADFPNWREQEDCPVLGIKLCWTNAEKLQGSSPTIDRIDSIIGYVPGNVALISHRANTIKNRGTIEEHRKIADWMEAGGK